MSIPSRIRLFVLGLRKSPTYQLLKYIAFVFYIIIAVFTIIYFWDTSRSGLEGDNLVSPKRSKEELLEAGAIDDVPKTIRAFEGMARDGLGALGVGVALPGEQTAEDIARQKKLYSFNKYVSDRIAIKRVLPDTRHGECKLLDYGNVEELPAASVILIFCNESMSALIRTVWSVINETPPNLLHEIVLIDDGSSSEEMTKLLPDYVKYRLQGGRKVHLHRNDNQTGLIAARLEGARRSTGDVIVFLDSHCEATRGWYEPLAFHIKNNPKAVAIPSIDSIDAVTLGFYGSPGDASITVGDFTWSGHFSWQKYKDAPHDRKASDPAPTATMAGGLFAMDRKYFWKLGGYDPGMIGWGGENLEMSFRVWQCGGRMDAIPCSHVGHIFRDTHPYFIPDDSHGKNTVRMAEVWMDDFKRFFYLYRVQLKNSLEGGADAIRERLELRSRLGCKSFSWYMDNIMPHKYRMDEQALMWGRLRNSNGKSGTSVCVDHLQLDAGHHLTPYDLGYYGCHSFLGSSQYFTLSKKHQFRNEYYCGEAGKKKDDKGMVKIHMTACETSKLPRQKWDFTKGGELKHRQTGLCMTYPESRHKIDGRTELLLSPCDGSESQTWSFEFSNST